MARRKRAALDLDGQDEAKYLAFREAQLGRLTTRATRDRPELIGDLPLDAQERFIATQLRARRSWAGPDDWSHRVSDD